MLSSLGIVVIPSKFLFDILFISENLSPGVAVVSIPEPVNGIAEPVKAFVILNPVLFFHFLTWSSSLKGFISG
jgi:hypothetical protein